MDTKLYLKDILPNIADDVDQKYVGASHVNDLVIENVDDEGLRAQIGFYGSNGGFVPMFDAKMDARFEYDLDATGKPVTFSDEYIAGKMTYRLSIYDMDGDLRVMDADTHRHGWDVDDPEGRYETPPSVVGYLNNYAEKPFVSERLGKALSSYGFEHTMTDKYALPDPKLMSDDPYGLVVAEERAYLDGEFIDPIDATYIVAQGDGKGRFIPLYEVVENWGESRKDYYSPDGEFEGYGCTTFDFFDVETKQKLHSETYDNNAHMEGCILRDAGWLQNDIADKYIKDNGIEFPKEPDRSLDKLTMNIDKQGVISFSFGED